MKRIALIGCGAQAKYASEIFHLLDGHRVTHVLAPENVERIDWLEQYSGRHVVGYEAMDTLIAQDEIDAALVCIAGATQKAELFNTYVRGRTEAISAIHPKAVIASSARIGQGCLINAGAVIQPLARIGNGVMIHANVIVEHDCRVDDWANLAPGCQLAGWVHVGEGATVFTGASVVPTMKIGKNSVVGAGAAVIDNVPDGAIAVGVPAKQIRKK